MSDTSDAVTLHAYARADTPAASGSLAMSQIADLYEFGLIGPGSQVWCNLEIPNAFWILSDTSFYLQIIDVPFAGWVRLRQDRAVWGRGFDDTSKAPNYQFSLRDMPIPFVEGDICTVAYRNSDPTRMRGQYHGKSHHFDDFVIEHSNMRVVDLKNRGVGRRITPIGTPTELHRAQAGARGVKLMTAGLPLNLVGESRRRTVWDHYDDAFTTEISADDIHRIRARQQSLDQATQTVTDRIIQKVADLPGFRAEDAPRGGTRGVA